MYSFNYHRPTSLDVAAKLRADCEDAVFLAGGQTLIPTLKQRLAAPTDVIDLSDVAGLIGIDINDKRVVIGAMTRHAEVARSNALRKVVPVLCNLAGQIGDGQVRNRGTIGGSIANSDPAADYPAAVIGLGATVHTNKRAIPAADYFRDLFETALEPGEIVKAIAFPVPTRAAYCKFPNPASRYAVAGVLVADFAGKIRVGVTGAGPCAFRAVNLEHALNVKLAPQAVDEVEIDYERFNSDLHATAEFRANLVRVMARRAVAALIAL
ncbi:MAG: xanthine dehydrogenase family protein subunit M [Proteobacteria bacterium]|jgi:carbon-monoxide dehydrogenase medium subunit|nr:xanthine dehydrogenase family protein subunit M [Pseudomonadota bacterium]